jgi:hypothetical protein
MCAGSVARLIEPTPLETLTITPSVDRLRIGMKARLTRTRPARMLDRLSDVPVIGVDAAWQVQAANDLAVVLLGESRDAQTRESNIAWRHFTGAASRVVRSPEAGRITLDCDVLVAQDSDLRLIVYTAAAGSPDARALLGTIGLQSFPS